MALRKDDPIYYKKKLTDLLNQAKENGIIIKESHGIIAFRVEYKIPWVKVPSFEQASVNVKEYIDK